LGLGGFWYTSAYPQYKLTLASVKEGLYKEWIGSKDYCLNRNCLFSW